MRVIYAQNVNDAFDQGVSMFAELVPEGARITPREGAGPGACIEAGPVTTVYARPTERVLWNVKRDCNPFFHLMESLWILAGRNDVRFLEQFAKRMASFSDDGSTFHGAYGYRWRHWFHGRDQLEEVLALLRREPATRRAILTMWSPLGDLIAEDGWGDPCRSKDLPCNLMVKFEVREKRLNMCVFNRSNDMIWGAYGANAVQFSVLQEYVAASLGVEVGRYWQISANFHVYEGTWASATGQPSVDHYSIDARPFPLVENHEDFLSEVEDFVNGEERWLKRNQFLTLVAVPMMTAWNLWRSGERAVAAKSLMKQIDATSVLNERKAVDWLLAGYFWMMNPKRVPCPAGAKP